MLELHNSSAARELADMKARNRSVQLKLLRAVYFLVKHRIPHTTVFQDFIELLVANGDEILTQHISNCPSNAQYTSKFTVNELIEVIDTWLDNHLIESLKPVLISPYYPMNAKISLHRRRFQFVVDGSLMVAQRSIFLTVLHVKATNVETIATAITSFISDKNLE